MTAFWPSKPPEQPLEVIVSINEQRSGRAHVRKAILFSLVTLSLPDEGRSQLAVSCVLVLLQVIRRERLVTAEGANSLAVGQELSAILGGNGESTLVVVVGLVEHDIGRALRACHGSRDRSQEGDGKELGEQHIDGRIRMMNIVRQWEETQRIPRIPFILV